MIVNIFLIVLSCVLVALTHHLRNKIKQHEANELGLIARHKHDESYLKQTIDKLKLDLATLKKEPTFDCRELMHQLTSQGSAVVRIELMDTTNWLMRSPRETKHD